MHTTVEQQLAGIAADPCNPEHPISDVVAWIERHGGNPAAAHQPRNSYLEIDVGLWHEDDHCRHLGGPGSSTLIEDTWDPLTTSVNDLCTCARRYHLNSGGRDTDALYILTDADIRGGLHKLLHLATVGTLDSDTRDSRLLYAASHVVDELRHVFPEIAAHCGDWLNNHEQELCRELHALRATASLTWAASAAVNDHAVRSLWDINGDTRIALLRGTPVADVVDAANIEAAVAELTDPDNASARLLTWMSSWTTPYNSTPDSHPTHRDWMASEATVRIRRQLTADLTAWVDTEHAILDELADTWYLIDISPAGKSLWALHGHDGISDGHYWFLNHLFEQGAHRHDSVELLLIRAAALHGADGLRDDDPTQQRWLHVIDGPPDMDIIRTAVHIHNNGHPVSHTYECASRLTVRD
jgi:hypothetical protein